MNEKQTKTLSAFLWNHVGHKTGALAEKFGIDGWYRLVVKAVADAVRVGDPIPMILHCPNCHKQHIDEVDEETNPGWDNPPHLSHKCLGCGTVWRPASVPTEGVAYLPEHGKTDTWPAIGRRVKS